MKKSKKTIRVGGLLLAGALGFAATFAAQAAVIFEQNVGGSPAPDGVESTADDQRPPAALESADGFMVNPRVALTTISWWGVYDAGVPAAGDDFSLRIFADNGGSPGSLPLAEYIGIPTSRTSTGMSDVLGAEIFEYSTGVAAGLTLDPGDYYLSVVNAVNRVSDSLNWFWTQGVGVDGENWRRDTTTSLAWGPADPPSDFDLAFRIEGDSVPGVAVPVLPTLLLMVPFVAFVARRRPVI